MARTLRTLGDSLLHRMVPAVTAGACVSGTGSVCCNCCFEGSRVFCFRINCFGRCVQSSSGCC